MFLIRVKIIYLLQGLGFPKKKKKLGGQNMSDLTQKSATSPRMMDFPSYDKTTAGIKKKCAKSPYLQGRSHSTVIIVLLFLLNNIT